MTDRLNLPLRIGARPQTSSSLPHSQLTQHGSDDIVAMLHEFCFSLPGVMNEHSGIAPPGTRALIMHETYSCNPQAFMVGREFAHIHPHPDSGSMHLQLPQKDAAEVIRKGFGEDHYLVTLGRLPAGLVLVFSPRDEDELEVVKRIVQRSYSYATEPVVTA